MFSKKQIERFVEVLLVWKHFKPMENCNFIFRKLLQVKLNCLSSRNISVICGMRKLLFKMQNWSKRIKCIISDGSDRFEGTFRRAIWPILVISQMFGAMPVVNVSNWSLSDLHFKWASLRTIYAVFVSTTLSIYSLFLLWKIFTDAVHLNMIGLSSLNEFVGWKKNASRILLIFQQTFYFTDWMRLGSSVFWYYRHIGQSWCGSGK